MKHIKNAFKHLSRVLKHKHLVFKYSCMFGIPLRGFFHDMSKFHPIEFFESVKYWDEEKSPLANAKLQKGWSDAWYHHRSRNRHHWEFWADNFEAGVNCPIMPYKYTVEMLCDWLAAGKTYHGKDFTFQDELDWWNNYKRDRVKMHPANKEYINIMLSALAASERDSQLKVQKFPNSEWWTLKSKEVYDRALSIWKDYEREIVIQ